MQGERRDDGSERFQVARMRIAQAARLRFPGRVAVLSSFGAESAVLLHVAASVDPGLPVLFLDTGQLFPETLAHRDALVRRLGLTDVRSIRPEARALAAEDPDGELWLVEPDRCCSLRKVAPLAEALEGFDAVLTGRKRFQGGLRGSLDLEDEVDGRTHLNPLVDWSAADLAAHVRAHALPVHPLVAQGFRSIGCMPCTTRSAPDEDARAGRWRGRGKTECGIHLPRTAHG